MLIMMLNIIIIRPIALYYLDGPSSEIRQLNQSFYDMEVYVIGIGDLVEQFEVHRMATDSTRMFLPSSYFGLFDIIRNVSSTVCTRKLWL